jgi:hypothetical protein
MARRRPAGRSTGCSPVRSRAAQARCSPSREDVPTHPSQILPRTMTIMQLKRKQRENGPINLVEIEFHVSST